MATTKFYLKDPKAEGETLIYLFFNYGKRRLKYSTGEKVQPKYWNTENQRVKKSLTGSVVINDYLQSLDEKVNQFYREGRTNGKEPNTDVLRELLNKAIDKQVVKPRSFYDYFDEFVEVRKPQITEGSLKRYFALKNHLIRFEKTKRYKLTFERINVEFLEKFTAYHVNDLELTHNTVVKNIKGLKAFMRWAADREYNQNHAFRKFKAVEKETEIIFMTEDELMQIYYFDLGSNSRLERVRDILCFECFTGLRFSDVGRVQKENIRNGILHVYTQKTKDKLEIPLNDYSLELLEKYDYNLPKLSNQKMNDYLKELGKACGINEHTSITRYIGTKEQVKAGAKWEFFSTHIGRRTFVTLSLEKGMRREVVKSITGHKDYKTLERYTKIVNKVKVVEMQQIWAKEPKEAPSLLKAV